jgi:hypothetical protein
LAELPRQASGSVQHEYFGMNAESLKDVIKQELPGLLREDPALRAYILELTRHEFADRAETGSVPQFP